MANNIVPIDILHTQQLAAELLQSESQESYEIDQELSRKYGIDLEDFHKLAKDLVPMCMSVPLPDKATPLQGFAHIDRNQGGFSWLMYQPMNIPEKQEQTA
jgi:hypothetical protein